MIDLILCCTESHCCAGSSLVVASRGHSRCSAQASYCGSCSHWGAQALGTQASVAMACAQLLLSMWNLPGPGSVYPAMSGGFLSTGPPGKSRILFIMVGGCYPWSLGVSVFICLAGCSCKSLTCIWDVLLWWWGEIEWWPEFISPQRGVFTSWLPYIASGFHGYRGDTL